MANTWQCDNCGTKTIVNPKSKTEIINGVPVTILLEPKCYIVNLRMGDESIQRDFCEEDYLIIKPYLDKIKQMLQEINPQ